MDESKNGDSPQITSTINVFTNTSSVPSSSSSSSSSDSLNIEINDGIVNSFETCSSPVTTIEITETRYQNENIENISQPNESGCENSSPVSGENHTIMPLEMYDEIVKESEMQDASGMPMYLSHNQIITTTTTDASRAMPVLVTNLLPAAMETTSESTTPATTEQCSSAPTTIQADSLSLTSLPQNNSGSISTSIRSIGSLVCRICHNAENPERLVSPCLCKGSLTYVHIDCLEHWMCMSGKTTCELCQFRYKTIQTLRYTCVQSLRMWYSRSVSRRALQEDCQLFSLLTLVVFGIIGTILVGIQYYYLHGYTVDLTMIWTQVWLVIFLIMTLVVYCVNVYMIVRSQLSPWYQWWQSARDIKLILENKRPHHICRRKTIPKNPNEQIFSQQNSTSVKMNNPGTTETAAAVRTTDDPVCSVLLIQSPNQTEQIDQNCNT